ncbi:hypothetical protein BsWGS_09345 [Bradybaena similaris]
MIAALLSLTLVVTVGSSSDSSGDTDAAHLHLEMIFPEDKFSEFSSCLSEGQFEQCIVYFTTGEFNITVDSIVEGDRRVASEEPCRYYTCDMSDIEGEIVCNRQTKSAACKTRLESQFLQQTGTDQRQSTCVLLHLSELIQRFMFNQNVNVDSCNASCLCQPPIATTQASRSYTETTTVPPASTDFASATTTTAAAATTTTTTVSSTPHTREGMSHSNTTEGISKTKNESSVNENETIENIGSNDTLVGNDNNDNGLSVGVIVAIVGACLIAIGIVLLLCIIFRKKKTRQPNDEYPMAPLNRRLSGELQPGQDSGANASLLGKDDAESCFTTKVNIENA